VIEVTFLFVTIDANDAPSIAAFWAAVLGTRVAVLTVRRRGSSSSASPRTVQERRLGSTRWRTLADPEGTEFDIALED
jgi:hypothetical protein